MTAFERLQRANPHAAEPLSPEERGRLVASIVASPPEEIATAPRVRRARPRLVPAVAFGLGLAVVLAAVLVLSGRGPGVAERAYAAVTEGRLYHLVARATVTGERPLRLESYYDTVAPAFHNRYLELRDGRWRLMAEYAGGPGGTRSYIEGSGTVSFDPEERPRSFDPLADFKRAYRSGRVRSQGEVTVDGRRAYRLVVDDTPPGAANAGNVVRYSRSTYLVDAETYLPIEQRGDSVIALDGAPERFRAVTRYEVAERLPRTRENLRNLRFVARPGVDESGPPLVLPGRRP